jgi:hypothetical protein
MIAPTSAASCGAGEAIGGSPAYPASGILGSDFWKLKYEPDLW